MDIANAEITKIITHEVVRATQSNDWPPILSNEPVSLNDHAKELVRKWSMLEAWVRQVAFI